MLPDDLLSSLLAIGAFGSLVTIVTLTSLKLRHSYLALKGLNVIQPSLPFIVIWVSMPSMLIVKLIDKYLEHQPSASNWLILIAVIVIALIYGLACTSREIIWNSDSINIRGLFRSTRVIPRANITSVSLEGPGFAISTTENKIHCDSGFDGSRKLYDALR